MTESTQSNQPTLQEYLDKLNDRLDQDAWYIVKQESDFDKIIKYIDLFVKYKKVPSNVTLDEYVKQNSKYIDIDNKEKKKNYRALKNGYNYGVLYNKGYHFLDAEPTNVYKLVKYYQGLAKYEPYYAMTLLNMLKQMQLEKLFVSNRYDSKDRRKGDKRKIRLFIVPILYKIFSELRKDKIKDITRRQFVVLVSSIRSYDDTEINNIIEYLKETHDNDNCLESLEKKFDSRVWNAIIQLNNIDNNSNKDKISLKDCYLKDANHKVEEFWDNLSVYKEITDDDYDRLLTNNVELWDWYKAKDFVPLGNIFMVNENERVKNGKNVIYYGAPGTGKSYKVDKLVEAAYKNDKDKLKTNVFRVTMHPEYTYTDFVGQILPHTWPDGRVDYRFSPNIFTIALRRAYRDPKEKIYLILEEMSRANTAAVFGDLFQLLDRDEDEKSEYSINNKDIAEYVYGDPAHPVTIPSNLTLYGTVNTSDQNVYVMDTAFKRRFEWKYVSTDEGTESKGFKNPNIWIEKDGKDQNGKDKWKYVDWKQFYQTLNRFIVNQLGLSEDKQIGPYFIKFGKTDSKDAHELVKDKLLQYLWDDVETVAYNTEKKLFLEKDEIPSFSVLYKKFSDGEPVFSKEFKGELGI